MNEVLIMNTTEREKDGVKEHRYDLIRLPAGGHIPVDILEGEYGVSWEIIATIPLGEPRDCNTFYCPICGESSYYFGVCDSCRCGVDENDELLVSPEDIEKVDAQRVSMKEHEHHEILRMIEQCDWMRCRYMMG